MALTNSVRLTEMERQWYQVRVAGSLPTINREQLQMDYWKSKVPAAKTYAEAEILWLKKVISDNGATPTAGGGPETLWAEMVASFGYPVSKYINQNKKIFYSTNTGTP